MKRTAYGQYIYHRDLAHQAMGLFLIENIEKGKLYYRHEKFDDSLPVCSALISLCRRASKERRISALRALL